MEYPPPIYLIMLELFAGHIAPEEASKMISLRLEMERGAEDETD